MPLIGISWLFLSVAVVCVGLVADRARPHLRRTLDEGEKVQHFGWRVKTDHTSRWVYSEPYSSFKTIDMDSTIQVRVQRSSKEAVLIGTVDMHADDFDEQITSLQRLAEERCASLNVLVDA